MSSSSVAGSGMGARLKAAAPYILLFAVTVWLWSVANGIQYDARPGELGPDFWPKAALALMGVLSVFQIAWAFTSPSGDGARGIGAALGADEEEDEEPRRPILLALGVGLTVVYALSLDTVGFPLATTAFLIAFMYVGGARNHLAIWASSVIGVALTAVLLMKVVYVSLPRGVAPFSAVTDFITGF